MTTKEDKTAMESVEELHEQIRDGWTLETDGVGPLHIASGPKARLTLEGQSKPVSFMSAFLVLNRSGISTKSTPLIDGWRAWEVKP